MNHNSSAPSGPIWSLSTLVLVFAFNYQTITPLFGQSKVDIDIDFARTDLDKSWALEVIPEVVKSTDFPDAATVQDQDVPGASQRFKYQRGEKGLTFRLAGDQSLSLARTVSLETLRSLEWEFSISAAPDDAGWQPFVFGIKWGERDYQGIVIGRDKTRTMVRYHGTKSHYYGGPRWETGKRYRAGFELSLTTLKAFFYPAELPPSLYRKQDLPEDMKSGQIFLSKAKGTGLKDSEIVLHSLKVRTWSPQELEQRRNALAEARRNWAQRSQEIMGWRKRVMNQPKVRVQIWDGSKTGYKDWALTEVAERGDIIQSRGGLANPEALLKAELSPAMYLFPRSHVKGEGDAYYLDPDFIQRSVDKSLELIEQWKQSGHTDLRVMLDSEYMAPPSDTPLVRKLAAAAGVLAADAPFPDLYGKHKRSLGVPRGSVPNDDSGYRFLRWWHSSGSFIPLHSATAKAIRERYPNVDVTTDPVMDRACVGQFKDMTMVQHWIRVHFRPRSPLSVAFYVERARAHQREGGQRICIGPQLGNDQIAAAATPADMLTEACWLAVAFGATDITHWGYQYIHYGQFEYRPGGESAWNALARLNRDLYVRHGKLLTRWKPSPRRAAVWLSHCDAVHQGTGRYDLAFAMERIEDLYRAVLTTGEPFDVIYDDDIRKGRLRDYKLVVTADVRTATADTISRLDKFMDNGGIFVGARGISLPGIEGIRIADIDWSEENHPKEMSPREYRTWLQTTGAQIMKKSGLQPRIRFHSPNVIANLMEADGTEYLVLVNDNRTFGEWASTHKNMAEDKGEPSTINFELDGAASLIGVETGNQVADENGVFRTRLEPGWGKILEIEK